MKKTTLVAVALSGALAIGAFAYGMNNQQGMMNGQYQQNMKRGQGMGMMHGGMQMFSQLNLTSEQQYKLSILRDEMRLEMKKQMHNEQPMGQMGSFFKGDNFDKDAFKNQVEKQHDKMLDLMANHMEKVFKILTKEQRAKLQTNMK